MTPLHRDIVEMTLTDAAPAIRPMDWFLWRPTNIFGKAIAIGGRGQYSHASKAAWWGDDLYCLEMLQWRGGQAVPMSKYVREYPGRIDVYHTNWRDQYPEYNRTEALRYMKGFVGTPYAWANIWKASRAHLAFLRLFSQVEFGDDYDPSDKVKRHIDLKTDRGYAFCSQAGVMADNIGGGVDQVPELSDRYTEPSDIAQTTFNKYFCTLVGV